MGLCFYSHSSGIILYLPGAVNCGAGSPISTSGSG
jgi:hypothetical protein